MRMSARIVLRILARSAEDVVLGSKGKRTLRSLHIVQVRSDFTMKVTDSIDVMTSLFLSITKFCTNVFLVSEESEPCCSSNRLDNCDGKSAVSLG